MTASASPAAVAATAALAAPVGQPASAPLTRVALAYIEARFKLYLRFGEPARTHQLDRWRRSAVFLPGAVFCRVRWQSNDFGTVRWQLMVMQACTPLDAAQRVMDDFECVWPDAGAAINSAGHWRGAFTVRPSFRRRPIQVPEGRHRGVDDALPIHRCGLLAGGQASPCPPCVAFR